MAGSSRSSRRGIAEEGRGDAEPLLHPERVRLDLVPRPIAQPDELEQLLDPAVRGRRSGGGERPQVLPAGQVRVEGRRLDERSDLEQPVPVAPAERPAEDLDRARVGMDQAGQQPHRRRLAGAVRAEEAVHDAGRHGQVQARQGDPGSVALREPARREGQPVRRHAAHPSRPVAAVDCRRLSRPGRPSSARSASATFSAGYS